jgi:FeS assembly SUF system protein
VEQLRKEAAAAPSAPAPTPTQPAVPPKHCDTTLVSRFADANKTPKQKAIEEQVVSACRAVYDPEIPVNIYDLGLIYSVEVDPQTSFVRVTMTLTAPGCPVAGELIADVGRRIEAIDDVPDSVVELVWDPPWTREMMSESARLELWLL